LWLAEKRFMLELIGDPAMRLSAKAVASVSAILWGASILLVGLIILAAPSYGDNFLHALSSVYPGFHASRTVLDVLAGTGYGILGGAVGGYLFAVLYNFFVPRVEKANTKGNAVTL
jgi:hypothetical protein